MQATIILDDALLSRAEVLTGIQGLSGLIEKASLALAARDAARRRAPPGASEPELFAVHRRRPDGA